MRARIECIASALPAGVLSNDELKSEFPEWSFERREERTGVTQRHIAADGETALDLADLACQRLFEENDIRPADIDGLIFCTETPDYLIPSNACLLHGRLELPSTVLALDINMGCSGFVYGLEVARSFIHGGTATRILFVTADTYSKHINPKDRATRVLFGDGAAATVISRATGDSGIDDIKLGADGGKFERFMIPAGGARRPRDENTSKQFTDKSGNRRSSEDITMDGFGVLSFFSSTMPGEVRALLARNDLALEDIDLFVFHQASLLAVEALAKSLKIPPSKLVFEMGKTGNLVSASIPVALKCAIDQGRAKPGDQVVLSGFGVGLSWATALVRL